MTNFSLRSARETESAQIRDLIHLVGINPMGLDWKRFIVAVNERDEMIGCVQLKPHGQEVLELASLAIYPDYRGQGIARALDRRSAQKQPAAFVFDVRSSRWGLCMKSLVFKKFHMRKCRVIFSGSVDWQAWRLPWRTGKNACW